MVDWVFFPARHGQAERPPVHTFKGGERDILLQSLTIVPPFILPLNNHTKERVILIICLFGQRLVNILQNITLCFYLFNCFYHCSITNDNLFILFNDCIYLYLLSVPFLYH
jgi:thiamine pyrophosphokinase